MKSVARAVGLALLIAPLILWLPQSIGKVDTPSMRPTIECGQLYMRDILSVYARDPRPGDIVAARAKDEQKLPKGEEIDPNHHYVKRVLAVEGQIVREIDMDDGRVEDVVAVGPGELYLVGDNLDDSHDSRQMGLFKVEDVVAYIHPLPTSWPGVSAAYGSDRAGKWEDGCKAPGPEAAFTPEGKLNKP